MPFSRMDRRFTWNDGSQERHPLSDFGNVNPAHQVRIGREVNPFLVALGVIVLIARRNLKGDKGARDLNIKFTLEG